MSDMNISITKFFVIEVWPTKIQFNNRRQNTRKISVLPIVHAHPRILNRFYINMSIVCKAVERIFIEIKLFTPYVPSFFCNFHTIIANVMFCHMNVFGCINFHCFSEFVEDPGCVGRPDGQPSHLGHKNVHCVSSRRSFS